MAGTGRRRAVLGGLAAAFLVVGGCTEAAPTGNAPASGSSAPSAVATASAEAAAGTTIVQCSVSIGTVPALTAGYRAVAGDVGVPRAGERYQLSEWSEAAGPTRYFVKWGLLVRTGAAADVTVGPAWTDKARVGWGQPGTPARAVHVQGCPAGTGTRPWTVFAGGLWTSGPGCVPVVIRSGDRQETITFPVAASCP